MSTMFAATTSLFLKEGKETDKNGNANLFLTVLAGKQPQKCIVLNGTQALMQEVYPGLTYLFNAAETTPDAVFGTQYNVTKIGELSVMDCVDIVGKLGAGTVTNMAAIEANSTNAE